MFVIAIYQVESVAEEEQEPAGSEFARRRRHLICDRAQIKNYCMILFKSK
jgi:hypothetical protein